MTISDIAEMKFKTEFINGGWMSPTNRRKLAPSICAYTDRFDKFSYWIAGKILLERETPKMAKLVEKLIKTMEVRITFKKFDSPLIIIIPHISHRFSSTSSTTTAPCK